MNRLTEEVTGTAAEASLSDELVPAQFFARRELATGEERLALGVLRMALTDYGSRDRNAKQWRAEIRAWTTRGSDYAFSFSHVCALLKLDLEQARTRMLAALQTIDAQREDRPARQRRAVHQVIQPVSDPTVSMLSAG